MHIQDLTTPIPPKIQSAKLRVSVQNYLEIIIGILVFFYVMNKIRKFYFCIFGKRKKKSDDLEKLTESQNIKHDKL